MKINFSEFTSAGLVRENNQDSLLAVNKDNCGLFAVADGMGGHYGGEIASSRLVEALKKWWDGFSADPIEFDSCADSLKAVITEVNSSIYEEFSKNGKICGTTVAMLLIYNDKYLVINAGDSRVYSKHGFKAAQESVDHVFGTEARIEGTLTADEINEHRNKNMLTSAVGCKEQFKMSVKSAPLQDCSFFICSDGVYKYCNEKNIAAFLSCKDNAKLERQVKSIVEGNGASDNFSYIKIDCIINENMNALKKYILPGAFALAAAAAAMIIISAGTQDTGKDNADGDQSQTSISDNESAKTSAATTTATETTAPPNVPDDTISNTYEAEEVAETVGEEDAEEVTEPPSDQTTEEIISANKSDTISTETAAETTSPSESETTPTQTNFEKPAEDNAEQTGSNDLQGQGEPSDS